MREQSILATIPEDVTPSWLDACAEMAEAVLACPRSVHYPTEPDERGFPSRENLPATTLTENMLKYQAENIAADKEAVKTNHKIAKAALKKIAQIRKEREGTEVE